MERKELKEQFIKEQKEQIAEAEAQIGYAKKRYEEEVSVWEEKLKILRLKTEAFEKIK